MNQLIINPRLANRWGVKMKHGRTAVVISMAWLMCAMPALQGSVEKVGVEPDPKRAGPASWNLEHA